MKALVTGGGGFLGGAIIRQLLARGDTARSFTRTAYPWLAELGVEQVQGAIEDPLAVERAVEGCDLVFHVAAKAGVWGRAADFYSTNVTGTGFSDANATTGTALYYTVTASNAAGESVASAQTSVQPLAAPASLTATAGNSSVSLAASTSSGISSIPSVAREWRANRS